MEQVSNKAKIKDPTENDTGKNKGKGKILQLL